MTKKLMLTIGSAFLLLINFKAEAQKLKFGAHAGVDLSVLSGLGNSEKYGKDDKTKPSPKIGFTGGAFLGYRFAKYIGVEGGIYYLPGGASVKEKAEDNSNKTGSNTDNKKNSEKGKFSISTNNIAIPVLAEIFPLGYNPEKVNVSIVLGPQIVLPLSVKTRENKKTPAAPQSTDANKKDKKDNSKSDAEDIKKHATSFDVCLLAGLRVEFPFGLIVHGGYHYGFMKLFKADDKDKAADKKEVTKYLTEDEKGPKLKKEGNDQPNLKSSYATFGIGYNFAPLLMGRK